MRRTSLSLIIIGFGLKGNDKKDDQPKMYYELTETFTHKNYNNHPFKIVLHSASI